MLSLHKTNMKKSTGICVAGIFAALCCVATLISIRLPFGYFNLGDIFVLISGWLLGPIFGALAAAIGTALADLLLGYPQYIPATFIIKGVMALLAFYTYHFILRRLTKNTPKLIISAIFSEGIMVVGYFAFEAIFLYGIGAVASIPGNALQGVAGIVGSTVLYSALNPDKHLRRYL